jgi:glucosamine 6-phosphate synthetase-like amidotransferase/phosphosugar isomerase protein
MHLLHEDKKRFKRHLDRQIKQVDSSDQQTLIKNSDRGVTRMCGIFGFSLRKPESMNKVFKVLQKLEVHRFPQEPRPVGGYGAGVAVLLEDGDLLVEKVGKVDQSPACHLSEMVEVKKASVLLGHVRMPSPEFMSTAKFRETAQPYVDERDPVLTLASVHNGKIENYKEIREKLRAGHVFESEKFELIDSEVIPHFFEEMLSEKGDVNEAIYGFFCALKGSNALAMLQLGDENSFLHLIHKGKTRGLTVWTNENGEVIFCSRKAPLMEEFGKTLKRGKFREKVSIPYREDVGLVLSYALPRR